MVMIMVILTLMRRMLIEFMMLVCIPFNISLLSLNYFQSPFTVLRSWPTTHFRIVILHSALLFPLRYFTVIILISLFYLSFSFSLSRFSYHEITIIFLYLFIIICFILLFNTFSIILLFLNHLLLFFLVSILTLYFHPTINNYIYFHALYISFLLFFLWSFYSGVQHVLLILFIVLLIFCVPAYYPTPLSSS